jgi:iron complex outermembrane receptor protein
VAPPEIPIVNSPGENQVVNCNNSEMLARVVGRPVLAISYVGLVMLSLLTAGNVRSQEALPRSTTVPTDFLQEIIVTAEKRESTVQSTPFSITAISGDVLLERGITNMEEIVQTTPGLSMRTSGPGETELEMRGLSSSGGSSPTVGFYLDETPLTSPAAALNGKVVVDPDLFDLKRVEVLRGPQGTLYGAGSMGGTVKLVTNPPELNHFAGVADASFSNTSGGGNNPGGDLMLNLPLIEDKLAVRLVGTDKYTSGWIDRIVVNPFPVGPGPPQTPDCGGYYVCTRGNVLAAPVTQIFRDANWSRLVSGRMSVLFQPTDTVKIIPMAMYQQLTSGGYSQFDTSPGTLSHYQPFDIAEPFSDRFQLYSLTVNIDFPWAQLTSASSYYSRTERQIQDTSETEAYFWGSFAGFFPFVPVPDLNLDTTIQRTQELRLASTGDGRVQWIVGGFVNNFESVWNYYQANPAYGEFSVGGPAANPQGIDYQAHNPYSVKQYALFSDVSYRPTDAIKVTTGLRWYKFETQVDYEQSGAASNTGNATQQSGTVVGNARGYNPKVNIAYEPTKDLTLYTEIAKGFRPGGVNLPVPADLCGPNIPLSYSPDSVWNYEIGEKARLLDGKVTINSDVYYIRWNDVQQFLTIPSCGFSYTSNAGNAHTYGPELELSAKLTSDITFAFDGTYTRAEITSVAAGNAGFLLAANQAIQRGTPLENVPKYTFGGSLTYNRKIFANYDFTARVADSYVGPLYDLAYYFEQLPGYNLIDIRAGVGRDRWRANAFITNLANKVALLSINTQSISTNTPALTRAATNQPRTVGVDLLYKF